MKEFNNYLSQFYKEGTPAENLPASKLVFTEAEMQAALSRALLRHRIYVHIEPAAETNKQTINKGA